MKRTLKMGKIALLLAVGVSSPSFADTYEERLAIAQEYTQRTVADMDFDALISTMYRPLLDQIQAQRNVTFSDEQIAQIHSLYLDTFSKPMQDMMLGQATLFADLMSLEEIKALNEFYRSDLGRNVMQKLPKLLESSQPMIVQMAQGKMQSIVPEVRKILELD